MLLTVCRCLTDAQLPGCSAHNPSRSHQQARLACGSCLHAMWHTTPAQVGYVGGQMVRPVHAPSLVGCAAQCLCSTCGGHRFCASGTVQGTVDVQHLRQLNDQNTGQGNPFGGICMFTDCSAIVMVHILFCAHNWTSTTAISPIRYSKHCYVCTFPVSQHVTACWPTLHQHSPHVKPC